MKNNPQLISALNSAMRSAQQAVDASARGKNDTAQQINAINGLIKVITALDARLVAAEEKLASQE